MLSLGQIEERRESLQDIRTVMQAMRTLAQVETHKLTPLLQSQRVVVEGIQQAALDFISCNAHTFEDRGQSSCVYLLIGTERGFCGSFNRSIVQHWQAFTAATAAPHTLLVIGQRLSTILREQEVEHQVLPGASIVEEIESVLLQLTNHIAAVQTGGVLELKAFYRDKDARTPMTADLLPPFYGYADHAPEYPHPPLLNLPPPAFLAGLIEQALNASLHDLLYTSLLAESIMRIEHLEVAIDHLDLQSARLQQKANFLRREEIIEEIEIILQSAEALGTD